MTDSPPSSPPRPTLSLGTAVLLGASVPTGWFLLDVFYLLTSSEPTLILDLLPSTLLVIGAAALLGPLLARKPLLALVGVPGLALVSKLPAFTEVYFDETTLWMIRMVMLMWMCLAAASVLHTRLGFGTLRAALCLGALAAAAQTYFRIPPHPLLLSFALTAVAALVLGCVPRARLRLALTALVLAWPLVQVGQRTLSPMRTARPDLAPPTATANPDAPNLIMIVIDTLRADHVGAYGYELRDTTPALDAFARDHGTLYTQARATSPYTLSSHASLLTGLQSVEHGATHPRPVERPIRPGVTTLGERLREVGYQTSFIVANGLYLCPELGISRGFEHFDNKLGGRTQPGAGFYLALGQLTGARPEVGRIGHRGAKRITDLSLDWLEERRDAPFFLAINYLDVHGPYLPPKPFDRAFSDFRPRDLLSLNISDIPLEYDRELAFTDFHLGRLLDELRSQGLFENTVIIVTSDHGEALGERGFPEHCWTMYENVTHVPLIIKPAGPRTVVVNDRRVSGAEVHDIALRELGLLADDERTSQVDPDLIGEWYGEEDNTWIPAWSGDVSIDMHTIVSAWFDGPRKVIVRSDGSVEAFDLASDPHELSPLPLTEAERAAALARAEQWWRDHPADPLEAIEFDEETLQGMQALGYMGGDEEEE